MVAQQSSCTEDARSDKGQNAPSQPPSMSVIIQKALAFLLGFDFGETSCLICFRCSEVLSQPLLLLHCDGNTAQTVLQRGDFPKLPKEVRQGSFPVGGGKRKHYRPSQHQQQRSAFIYDPIICTVAQQADFGAQQAESSAGSFDSNTVRLTRQSLGRLRWPEHQAEEYWNRNYFAVLDGPLASSLWQPCVLCLL
ncbi:hypothetical protein ACSSS7_003054 [Eimeria intestinalis]